MQLPPMVTDRAFARLAEIADLTGAPRALRVAVEGGGCSGFQYKFDLADSAEADDSVSETAGVRLVVDPMSFMVLFILSWLFEMHSID